MVTFCVTCRSKVQLQIVKKCTLAGLWLGETPQFDSHTHIHTGPYLGILRPWAQENFAPHPYLFVFSYM
jgi:hypothetical protein